MSAASVSPITTYFRVCDGVRVRFAEAKAHSDATVLTLARWPETLFAFWRIWDRVIPLGRIVALDMPGFSHSDHIGATVEVVAGRDRAPEVHEDYVSAYDPGRFAESARFVRHYPEQNPVLRDLLPSINTPAQEYGRLVVEWVSGGYRRVVRGSSAKSGRSWA